MPKDGGNAIYFDCNSGPPIGVCKGDNRTSDGAAQAENSRRQAEEEARRQRELQEHQRREAEERRRIEEEKLRQEEFERKKAQSLKSLKGVSQTTDGSGSLKGSAATGLKGAGPSTALGLKGTGEKKDSQAAALLDWCKRHWPTGSDRTKVVQWYRQCASLSSPGPASGRSELKVALPKPCSACLGDYDRESRDCLSLSADWLERVGCLNASIGKWLKCQDTCRSEPNDPVRLRQ
jgi:hypothetical protein